MLYHLDAWRVDDESVFEQLRIGELVAAGNMVVVEWYDQVAEWMERVLSERGARLVTVKLTEKNGKRTAEVAVCDYGSEGQ